MLLRKKNQPPAKADLKVQVGLAADHILEQESKGSGLPLPTRLILSSFEDQLPGSFEERAERLGRMIIGRADEELHYPLPSNVGVDTRASLKASLQYGVPGEMVLVIDDLTPKPEHSQRAS